ncbi:hypothetical protein [Anaerosinus massiliensis]|uniref:hypothetical protein n=1 Tax=Massilibacillus massiliensis TaxID=1806837 RepID=UPI000DA5F810|nr:hypothetical protein [Massilibacillus massiliensis]
MKIRIAVAGSNQLNAEEVLGAAKLIIGDSAIFTTVITNEIKCDDFADLFICAATQAETLKKVVPQNKIIVLDLMPTSQFFVQVARIPAGEDVYIFNSNLRYPARLAKACKKLGIEVNFISVAYEAMPQDEVIAALKKAKYIIGIKRLVGETILLSEKYASYLREDVVIIGTTRVASMQSACMLIQWVATYFHQFISKQVTTLTNKMKSSVVHAKESDYGRKLASVADDLEKLMAESNTSMLTMHDVVMKSFANQISPDIMMFDHTHDQAEERKKSEENSSSNEIVKTLENINCLSDKITNLSHQI